MPPVPPGVAAQQGPPPIRQFAQAGAGAQAPGSAATQGDSGQDSNALLSQLVDQVGQNLTKIAQITGQTKPELIPILKQAVQAMVMFAGKVKTGSGAPVAGQGGTPQGGDPGSGGNQGTAADTAPEAGGSTSLGMPQ